jgi:hypothetical protein
MQKSLRLPLIACLVALSCATSASAGVVFSDNFSGENGGASQLNYTGFAKWTVSNGTVDLIRDNTFGIRCRGNTGSCVDLDGSTMDSGPMLSNPSVAFAAGDTVVGEWWISRNQRRATVERVTTLLDFDSRGFDLIDFSFFLGAAGSTAASNMQGADMLSTSADVGANAGFERFGFSFTAAAAGAFQLRLGTTSNDNVGAVLDDVSISVTSPNRVPEPGSLALVLGALAAVGASRRLRVRSSQA